MSDNTYWCTVICTIVLAIACTIMTGLICDKWMDAKYVDAGYTRAVLPGHDWPVWVKPERKDAPSNAPSYLVPGYDPKQWIMEVSQ